MEDGGKRKRESATPVIYCILWIIIFSILNYFIGKEDDYESSWTRYLLFSSVAATLLIGFILNYFGCVLEFRNIILGSYLLIQILTPFISIIWFGTSLAMDDALSSAIVALIIVGLGVVTAEIFKTSYGFLRVFVGFKNCDKIERGIIIAGIPEKDLLDYGPKIIERKVRYELEGAIYHETSSDTLTWRRSIKYSGYEILHLENLIVFHKIEDGIMRTLFVPKNGIVCNLDANADVIMDFRYSLDNVLHFEKPLDYILRKSSDDIERAFREYARASDVSGYLREHFNILTKEFWFKKKWAIPSVFSLIGFLTLCIIYRDSIVAWISVQENTNTIYSIGGIIGIIATILTPLLLVMKGRKNDS